MTNVCIRAENIYITGSVAALQNWSPDTAIILSPDNYPVWSGMCISPGMFPIMLLKHSFSVTINIPENSNTVEYKYIRKNNGAVTWESDPNRSINVATDDLSVSDTWR
jgi:glucoamylase